MVAGKLSESPWLPGAEERNGVWFYDNAPEELQFFRGKTLLYIMSDPVYGPNSPLRNNLFYSRLSRARALGAVIVDTWRNDVTHIVVSTHQTWNGMLDHLHRVEIPSEIQVVRDGYLDECVNAHTIVEPSALQCLTPTDNLCPPAGHALNLPRMPSTSGTKKRKRADEESADEGRAAKKAAKELYNPFQGDQSARQLEESCQDFLQRLAPSQLLTGEVDRLLIASPAADWSHQPDLKDFKFRANEALNNFLDDKWALEKDLREGERLSLCEKARLRTLRKGLETNILTIAKQTNIISGRWLLDVAPEDINKAWQVVAESTLKGELGCAAEVAPTGEKLSILLSVYTSDINDKDEVKRVLDKLRELQVIKPSWQIVYYKALAYTELELRYHNEYGIRASLYSSDGISEA
ncbi:hypothetical protein ABEF95_004500 [Exophiala dermatitidis]